jgi:hypothetical protein
LPCIYLDHIVHTHFKSFLLSIQAECMYLVNMDAYFPFKDSNLVYDVKSPDMNIRNLKVSEMQYKYIVMRDLENLTIIVTLKY